MPAKWFKADMLSGAKRKKNHRLRIGLKLDKMNYFTKSTRVISNKIIKDSLQWMIKMLRMIDFKSVLTSYDKILKDLMINKIKLIRTWLTLLAIMMKQEISLWPNLASTTNGERDTDLNPERVLKRSREYRTQMILLTIWKMKEEVEKFQISAVNLDLKVH